MEYDSAVMKKLGFSFTTREEMFSSELFTKYRVKSEEQRKMFLETDTEGSCGKCHNCGSENTFLIEKQRRSADEAKSFDIQCGNCQASWPAK